MATLKQLVDRGFKKATALGHEMELVTSNVDSAFYRCKVCRQTFAVGHDVQIGSRHGKRPLKLTSAAVLSIRCPGRDITP